MEFHSRAFKCFSGNPCRVCTIPFVCLFFLLLLWCIYLLDSIIFESFLGNHAFSIEKFGSSWVNFSRKTTQKKAKLTSMGADTICLIQVRQRKRFVEYHHFKALLLVNRSNFTWILGCNDQCKPCESHYNKWTQLGLLLECCSREAFETFSRRDLLDFFHSQSLAKPKIQSGVNKIGWQGYVNSWMHQWFIKIPLFQCL